MAAVADDLDAAFPAFVRRYQHDVFTLALRWCASRQDAEDLAQETFVSAYRALRRYPPPQVEALRARPFLVTIALNGARNAARRARRRPVEVPLNGQEPAPQAGGGPAEDHDEVSALLGRLPEASRLAVVLRCGLGMPYAEMAEVTGEPVGTLKARVSRALARLREEP